ncbi:MAG: DUF616 domain-containing protein [Bacteroidales bacterium]|nr:DUF616 domain-containing protein [Bacteroidales bacterium]
MTGSGNIAESAFEEIYRLESLANSYRNYLSGDSHPGAYKLPWWKRIISDVVTRWIRIFGRYRAKKKASWRSMGVNLALDKQKAVERKSLYISQQRIIVYTAHFGSYDLLREPLLRPDNIDYYVLTDQEIPEDSVWERLDCSGIIPIEYREDPILANRWCKMHPHLIFKDSLYSVYLDSNIWVLSDLTPLIAGLDTYPVAMFRHKKRDCVYDEVQACLRQNKDKKKSLKAHLEVIRSHGVPVKWGLLEASVIARKHSEPECMSLMDAWWEAFTRNSRRDQISLIDCLWVKGIHPSVIGTLGDNLQRCDLFLQMYHENTPEAVGQPIDLPGLIKCKMSS